MVNFSYLILKTELKFDQWRLCIKLLHIFLYWCKRLFCGPEINFFCQGALRNLRSIAFPLLPPSSCPSCHSWMMMMSTLSNWMDRLGVHHFLFLLRCCHGCLYWCYWDGWTQYRYRKQRTSNIAVLHSVLMMRGGEGGGEDEGRGCCGSKYRNVQLSCWRPIW